MDNEAVKCTVWHNLSDIMGHFTNKQKIYRVAGEKPNRGIIRNCDTIFEKPSDTD